MAKGKDAKDGKPVAKVLVGVVGILLLIATVVGSYTGVHDAVAIAYLPVGGLLLVAAGLWDRLKEIGLPGGAKIFVSAPVPKQVIVGDYQATHGEVFDVGAIESSQAFGTPNLTALHKFEVTRGRDFPSETARPHVVLAKVAVEELARFGPAEREAVIEELPQVGSGENEYDVPNQQYRARRVGDDALIYFRQRDKLSVTEPNTYVVLGFLNVKAQKNLVKMHRHADHAEMEYGSVVTNTVRPILGDESGPGMTFDIDDNGQVTAVTLLLLGREWTPELKEKVQEAWANQPRFAGIEPKFG